MKRFCILFLLFIVSIFIIEKPSLAATVGNPLDLDLPAKSAVLRQEVINQTLDGYEEVVKIKSALDLEYVFEKDLNTSFEVDNAKLEGQWYMVKLGATIFNRIEPYIKIGTSNLGVKWRQGSTDDIEVDADYGFAWGGGIKGIIWDFDNWGIRLTGDLQCRTTESDVSEISRGGGNINVTDTGADFKVDEWQLALLLSKKFELPLRWQNIYIVPYTGLSISDSTVDVAFKDSNSPGTDYSLFDANNEKIYGFLIGCDIMPSLKSFFSYSIELKLIDEIALTLGGAMKF